MNDFKFKKDDKLEAELIMTGGYIVSMLLLWLFGGFNIFEKPLTSLTLGDIVATIFTVLWIGYMFYVHFIKWR